MHGWMDTCGLWALAAEDGVLSFATCFCITGVLPSDTSILVDGTPTIAMVALLALVV
jgi:hypothetical protein